MQTNIVLLVAAVLFAGVNVEARHLLAVSKDGSCGARNNGNTCPPGTCCSQFGYCGKSAAFCAGGCQSAYGVCNSTPSTPASPSATPPSTTAATPAPTSAQSLPESRDGSCGAVAKTKCTPGKSCSQFGYCGSSTAYTFNCQPGYGGAGSPSPCAAGSPITPPPATTTAPVTTPAATTPVPTPIATSAATTAATIAATVTPLPTAAATTAATIAAIPTPTTAATVAATPAATSAQTVAATRTPIPTATIKATPVATPAATSAATSTATPAATAAITATPTPSATSKPNPTATPTVMATATATPAATVAATVAATTTPTPTPTAIAAVTATPTATLAVTPTATPTPTATKAPNATATPAATLTATPTPTATKAPNATATATPRPTPVTVVTTGPLCSQTYPNVPFGYTDKTGAKTVALTFDDAPDENGNTDKVLDALKAAGVKATFYVNGNNYCDASAPPCSTTLARIKAEGHDLGGHTFNHPHTDTLTDAKIDKEFSDLNSLVGQSMTEYRMPFGEPFQSPGACGPGGSPCGAAEVARVAKTTSKYGVHVGWTFDGEDFNCAADAACVTKNYATFYNSGQTGVVLHHSVQAGTANALPAELALGKSKGYTFVTSEYYIQQIYGMSSAAVTSAFAACPKAAGNTTTSG